MNKVRFGIVGVGNMGGNHLQSLKKVERAELTAVCDFNRQRADSVAAEHGVKAFYDHRDLYASGMIDAVLIVTPHYAHTPLTIDAFSAGLHVLCDKPIAVHKGDAEKMLAAHRLHPELQFAVMFQMRTSPLNIKLKELIESGELGRITRINWIVTDWFRTQAYYDSGTWRATWEGEGGGVLLNQCPHQLDLFQWFFGMPDKVRAFCALGKTHRIEVEDEVMAYFEYTSGATAVFIASTGEAPGTNRLEITAENGRVLVESGRINLKRTEKPVRELLQFNDMFLTIKTSDEEINIPSGGLSPELVIAGLVDAVLDGKPLVAEGSDGIRSVELANAMLYSSLCGETIQLPLDAAKFESRLRKLIVESSLKKKKHSPRAANLHAELLTV